MAAKLFAERGLTIAEITEAAAFLFFGLKTTIKAEVDDLVKKVVRFRLEIVLLDGLEDFVKNNMSDLEIRPTFGEFQKFSQ